MLTFPILDRLPWLAHGFTLRPDGVDANTLREDALSRLREQHQQLLKTKNIEWNQLRFAEQVHGNRVVVMDEPLSPRNSQSVPGADGMVTSTAGMALGIYVADCCAVYLVETQRRAIGLLHSGRKGTEANIVREGVQQLKAVCHGEPSRMAAVLSPCIHECCYDVDFTSEIENQLKSEGVMEIWRHPDCTGCRLDRYYSYRKEKGRTGRMLAFMMAADF